MHTRSRGNTNLLEPRDDIHRLQRPVRTRHNRVTTPQQNPIDMDDNFVEIPLHHGGNGDGHEVDGDGRYRLHQQLGPNPNQGVHQHQPEQPQPNQPAHQQRRNNTVGEGDNANAHHNRQGIHAPAVDANNFEVRIGLINMVQNNKFHGLSLEDPLDHIDNFDKVCDLLKMNGVTEDSLKLRLFPFSLADRAHQWEKNLPQGSVTTWPECKKQFLSKFFSPARTAKLRNEISSFTQRSQESFHEAWDRFRTYTYRCPHHGFTNATLLSTLYRGALPKFRQLLDTASNGNFLAKDVDEAMELVENLALSDGTYGDDFDRTARHTIDFDDSKRSKDMKSLNERMDKQTAMMDKQSALIDRLLTSHKDNEKAVNFVTDYDDSQIRHQDGKATDMGGQEEVNYVSNQNSQGYQRQGFSQNYRSHPNLSYRSNNVENPQDQHYPSQAHQASNPTSFSNNPTSQNHHGFQRNQVGFQPKPNFPPPGFQKTQGGFHQQGQSSSQQAPQPDLNSMFQQLLKGQSDINTKVESSYNDLNSKIETMNNKIQQLESNAASASTRQQGQLPGKSIANPKEYVQSIELRSGTILPPRVNVDVENNKRGADLQDVDEFEEDPYSRDMAKHYKAMNDAEKEYQDEVKARTKTVIKEQPKKDEFVPPQYEPKLPFPGRFKKQLMEKYKALFNEQIRKVELIMPLVDALVLVPQHAKFLKEAISERAKEIESSNPKTQDVSSISEMKIVPKDHEDPGSFTLPCKIGPLAFDNCLCDLGASVSLMPFSLAKRMGYTKYKSTNISLILADRTVRTPIGMLEDLPITVGNFIIPTDFVVLEMEEEPKDPLIFGRPFLANAGAIIDVRRGDIDLHLSKDEVLKFKINKEKSKSRINGQCFSIVVNDELKEDTLNMHPPNDDIHVVDKENKPTPTVVPQSLGSLMGIDQQVNSMGASKGKTSKAEISIQQSFRLGSRTDEEALALDGCCLGTLFSTIMGRKKQSSNGEGPKVKKKKHKADQPNTPNPSFADLTLVPWKYEAGGIQYKVRCKGKSKPFHEVKGLQT